MRWGFTSGRFPTSPMRSSPSSCSIARVMGGAAVYRNTDAGATFLDKASPAYIGGMLEMSNGRLYRFWGDLTVVCGNRRAPERDQAHRQGDVRVRLYRDEGRLEQFMNAMAGISAGPFHALAESFDFSEYETLCDVGGATGQLSIILANGHPPPEMRQL